MTIKIGTEVEIKKIPKSHKHLIGKMATVIRQSHNRRDLYLVRVCTASARRLGGLL